MRQIAIQFEGLAASLAEYSGHPDLASEKSTHEQDRLSFLGWDCKDCTGDVDLTGMTPDEATSVWKRMEKGIQREYRKIYGRLLKGINGHKAVRK